jgi:putative transposase
MAIPGRLAGAGTYFVTSVTSGRRRLFQIAVNAELFLETLQAYRRQGHYKLHAFVVMPDHIHLLLTPQGETVERVMGLIKGGSSHRFASKGQFGNVASQIIAFAMQRTSGPGSRTSIKIL